MSDITPQLRLISSLAETMKNDMWADDIVLRCNLIEKAIQEIRQIAYARRSGER